MRNLCIQMLEYMKLSRVELMIRAKTDEKGEKTQMTEIRSGTGDISACLTMSCCISNVYTLVEMETFL